MKTSSSTPCKLCGRNIALTYEFMRQLVPDSVQDGFLKEFVSHANSLFSEYGVNSCDQVFHLLAQGKHETKRYTAFRESLNYTTRSYTAESLYRMAPTAIDNGFSRKGLILTRQEKIKYVEDNLIANDAGYGEHCFGSNVYPNNDYRGRGLLHLTHYDNYHTCAQDTGYPIDAQPNLVQDDTKIILVSGLWFWRKNNLGIIAEDKSMTLDQRVREVTIKINPGLKGLEERKIFTSEISTIFSSLYGACQR